MRKVAIGLDFGTLSVRSLFLDVETAEELASAVFEYPHKIMSETLPDNTPLPPDFALEHPDDFKEGLRVVVREGMKQAGLLPEEIIGIGVDVTTATVLALDKNRKPLSEDPKFFSRPEAWMKLWKHHGALEIADRLYEVAEKRGESWLSHYGGWLSPELFIPKAVEPAVKDPEVFAATDCIIEAADWIVYLLTGELTRSTSLAGCNSLYRQDTGYPSAEYFEACYPGAGAVPEKLKGRMVRLGDRAGCLTDAMAEELGLLPGIPVGAAHIDSHAAVVGCGASRVGDMVSTIGTTANNILNGTPEPGPGIAGTYSAAVDASVPGLYGYEGGQNCVGDCLAWYVKEAVPAYVAEAAKAEGTNVHTYLTKKASALRPGESGLLALDWFNGVRTPLKDLTLSSTIVGLSVRTKPEEVYRALCEAVIYGNKRIIDLYEDAGAKVTRIIAAGGIPGKNPLMMQIYADVTGKDIYLSGSTQASARGSAILGAAAAGCERTGDADVSALIERLGCLSPTVYHPIPENVAVYKKLYAEYRRLSDIMSDTGSVVKNLKAIADGQ